MSNFVNLLDIIYPVGSVYITFNTISPASSVGGTWELLKNVFLYSSTGSTNVTGGEKSCKLTQQELPYTYGLWTLRGTADSFIAASTGAAGAATLQTLNPSCWILGYDSSGLKAGYSSFGFEFGADKAHNNMPPYITVHMYRRTA